MISITVEDFFFHGVNTDGQRPQYVPALVEVRGHTPEFIVDEQDQTTLFRGDCSLAIGGDPKPLKFHQIDGFEQNSPVFDADGMADFRHLLKFSDLNVVTPKVFMPPILGFLRIENGIVFTKSFSPGTYVFRRVNGDTILTRAAIVRSIGVKIKTPSTVSPTLYLADGVKIDLDPDVDHNIVLRNSCPNGGIDFDKYRVVFPSIGDDKWCSPGRVDVAVKNNDSMCGGAGGEKVPPG